MRVLHVVRACAHGGIETFLANLIPLHQQSGIEVEIYFYDDCGASDTFKGVCPIIFKEDMYLADLLAKRGYDIIHLAHNIPYGKVRRAIQISGYGGGTVMTLHQCGIFDPSIDYDMVIAVSGATARSVAEEYSRNFKVIYNGLDMSRFYPPQSSGVRGQPVIAWVGRTADPVKRFGLLLDVAKAITHRGFRIEAIDGSPVRTYDPGSLPANVNVTVQKPWAEMPDFYRSVAASGGFLLSTSSTEACPVGIMEALSCGCPVIAPAVGGIPEVVSDTNTGFIYPADPKISDITDAIDRLYSGDYQAIARNAAEYARKNFAAQVMADRYAQVYKEVYSLTQARKRPSVTRRVLVGGLSRVLVPYNNWLTEFRSSLKKRLKGVERCLR